MNCILTLDLGLAIKTVHGRHSQRIGTGSSKEEQCQNVGEVNSPIQVFSSTVRY